MRRGKVGKKVVELTEKEYRMLLSRFNLKNVTVERYTGGVKRYIIGKPCICVMYENGGCYNDKLDKECPLRHSSYHTCSILITELLGENRWYFILNTDYISWSTESQADDWARDAITKIRKALLSMEKVGYEKNKNSRH